MGGMGCGCGCGSSAAVAAAAAAPAALLAVVVGGREGVMRSPGMYRRRGRELRLSESAGAFFINSRPELFRELAEAYADIVPNVSAWYGPPD